MSKSLGTEISQLLMLVAEAAVTLLFVGCSVHLFFNANATLKDWLQMLFACVVFTAFRIERRIEEAASKVKVHIRIVDPEGVNTKVSLGEINE